MNPVFQTAAGQLRPDAVRVRWLPVGEGGVLSEPSGLSAEEFERYRRFRNESAAAQFAVSRIALRQVLGEALGVEPGRVEFTVGPHGKPQLSAPFDVSGVEFNVSHCAGLAVIALAVGRRVGVDVERVDRRCDVELLSRTVFTEAERAVWDALPEERRRRDFFRAWTRKEAVLKAIGSGLSIDPRRIETGFDPMPRLAPIRREPGVIGGAWCGCELDAGEAHLAALVVEGDGARVEVVAPSRPRG